MVGKGDDRPAVEFLVQAPGGLRHDLRRGVDDLRGNLAHQVRQALRLLRRGRAEFPVHQGLVKFVPAVAAVADALSHQDALLTVLVQNDHNVVVDRPVYPHRTPPLSNKKACT